MSVVVVVLVSGEVVVIVEVLTGEVIVLVERIVLVIVDVLVV